MPAPLTHFDPIVYVIDDDPDVLDAISLLLRVNGLQVAAYPSPHAFLAQYTPHQIACLILDLRMPGLTGLEVQQSLLDRDIDIPVIFITGHGDVAQCSRAFKAGAVDFLTKPLDDKDLLHAVHRAIQHSIGQHEKQAHTQEIATRLARLSKREIEVLPHIVNGLSSKEIAARLALSPRTVEAHRANICSKLNVDSLANLVKFYLLALETPGSPSLSLRLEHTHEQPSSPRLH